MEREAKIINKMHQRDYEVRGKNEKEKKSFYNKQLYCNTGLSYCSKLWRQSMNYR